MIRSGGYVALAWIVVKQMASEFVLAYFKEVKKGNLPVEHEYAFIELLNEKFNIEIEYSGSILPDVWSLSHLARTQHHIPKIKKLHDLFAKEFDIDGQLDIDRAVNLFMDNTLPEDREEYFDCFFSVISGIKSKNKLKEARSRILAKPTRADVLYALINKNKTIYEIDNMSGKTFEVFLAEFFMSKGLTVETTPATNDHGADLLIYRGKTKFCMQLKRQSSPVGNNAVQEVLASLAYYNSHCGVVLTSSTFTAGATKLAAANNLILLDRDDLLTMLKTREIPF